MGYLKSKSQFNLEAARVLIDEHQYFAPSVHCSYYGCFQYIKYKLNTIGISYQKMDDDVANSRQDNVKTLNSNTYPIDLIFQEIKKSDILIAKDIRDKIKTLKAFRVKSDYHNEEIDYPKSNTALKLSEEIISLINKKI